MNLISRFIRPLKRYGFSYTLRRIITKSFESKIKGYAEIEQYFKNKEGIEIGGPSEVFRLFGYIPIYTKIRNLDGVNFSNNTIWEGDIFAGNNYVFNGKKAGKQFIIDASDLSSLDSKQYDFLVSSNCLEHIANPIKALMEWLRVVKQGGVILVLVPNNKNGIDKYRPVTKFTHILEDFQKNVGEDDLTHLDEVLENHNLEVDIEARDFQYFKNRSLNNYNHRTIHHHVFDINLLKELFIYLNIEIILTDDKYTFVTVLGKKR